MITSDDARSDNNSGNVVSSLPSNVNIPALEDDNETGSPAEFYVGVERRRRCFDLAREIAPDGVTIYDLVAMADWLERGPVAIHDEPEPCACNNAEATHPRGDSAFCHAVP